MINKDANDFMGALATLINESGLPPVVIRLSLESAMHTVMNLENKAIDDEIRTESRKKVETEPEVVE